MLDLHKLHAFVVVIEERNITHAANRLFIQQPPLTRLLKKLEEELGTQLLIRQPRGIEPTEAGLALFKEAQFLLEHARHIPKLVQDVSQGKTGQLNIGFTSSAGLHPLISLVLRSYREIYPKVQTKLEEAGSQKQLDRLISEKLDIAFLRAPISRDIGLKHHHILDEPMMVALPIGHPLTQKKKLVQMTYQMKILFYTVVLQDKVYMTIFYIVATKQVLVHALFKKRLDLPLH